MSVGRIKASIALEAVILISTFLTPFSMVRWYTAIEDYGTAWFFVFGLLYRSEWLDYSRWVIPLWLEDASIVSVIAPLAFVSVWIGLSFAIGVILTRDASQSFRPLVTIALALVLVELGIAVFADLTLPRGGESPWYWYGHLFPLPINMLVALAGLIIVRHRRDG